MVSVYGKIFHKILNVLYRNTINVSEPVTAVSVESTKKHLGQLSPSVQEFNNSLRRLVLTPRAVVEEREFSQTSSRRVRRRVECSN